MRDWRFGALITFVFLFADAGVVLAEGAPSAVSDFGIVVLVSTNMFSFTLRAWRGIILP